MAKNKYKLNKLHKIKIHHNRWLIWALAYAFFVSIALVGYIKVSDINLDTQLIAENNFMPGHSYTDKVMGFNLKYPSNWSIEANSPTSLSFTPENSNDSGVAVSTIPLSAEKALRKSLHINGESPITVDGVAADEIYNDLGNDGHFEVVLLVRNNKKLYVIRGTKELVDQLLQTFNFLTVKP